MMTQFEEYGNVLEPKLKKMSNFKIGKTGQTIEDRYNEEYNETYTSYIIVGTCEDAYTIDEFEKYLIDRFKELPKCDNEQIGGGEMKKSKEYLVYVMYNELRKVKLKRN